MKSFLTATALLAWMIPALCTATPQYPSLREQYNIRGDTGMVISMPAESAIKIIGPITDSTLASYLDMRPKYPFTTVVVDSGGGDIDAAIGIATDMRRHGLRLVVAGRCFSACANYLFAGATHKDVRPGSLVAIHNSIIVYYLDKSVFMAPQRHPQRVLRLDTNGRLGQQIARLARIEDDFYAQTNVARKNYAVFDDYQIRKKHALFLVKKPACQNIDFWVLPRSEMEKMRINGLDAVWMPPSPAEAAVTAKNLGLDPAKLFFGTGEQLAEACRNRV